MTQGDGMSFAEFSYPLLQAWDWWHMYSNLGVQMQVGGSDQYGNIIAGMDAIRYMSENHPDMNHVQELAGSKDMVWPFGVTVPLLTTGSGAKFGKSAGNAVWLDPNLTTPFDVYGVSYFLAQAVAKALLTRLQFLLKSADADVERYLKLFTFVSMADIATVMKEHTADPGKRQAQHLLAREVIALVHGDQVAADTAKQHHSMRRPSLHSLSSGTSQVRSPQQNVDSSTAASFTGETENNASLRLPREAVHGQRIAHIIAQAGLVGSRGEGQRAVASGGVYAGTQSASAASTELEFVQVRNDASQTGDKYLLDDKMLVLRLGKWKVRIIEVE